MTGLSGRGAVAWDGPMRLVAFWVGLALTLCVFGGCGRAAHGAVGVAAPAWRATVVTFPTVQPGGVGRRGRYDVVVENVGATTSEGEVTVKDVLPAGLSPKEIITEPIGAGNCPTETAGEVVCSFSSATAPSGFMVVTIEYEVTGALALGSALTDVATVSGGGAAQAARGEAVTSVGGETAVAQSGVSEFAFEATGVGGEPFDQAGGHPHFLTTTLLLNDVRDESVGVNEPFKPVEPVKDLEFYLPLGFLGDVTVAAQCPASLVEMSLNVSGCSPSSRVGSILPMLLDDVFAHSHDPTHVRALYNVVPEKGYVAELAFGFNNQTFFLYANVVRHDGQYVVRISTPNLSGVAAFVGAITTFYGDIEEHFNGAEGVFDRGAFLTLPSDCEASPQAREAKVEFDTWKEPGVMVPGATEAFPQQFENCGLLGFSSVLSVTPQTTQAEAPSGYELGLTVPQAPNGGTGLGTPPVKSVRLTLPEGTAISPSGANELQACQATGPEGINIEGAESEEVAADGLKRPAVGHCREASQIASVTATSPLLSEPLQGHLFVAAPECGGAGQEVCEGQDAENGRLFRVYLEVGSTQMGIVVKLAGHASVNTTTGRITTVFEENPQFPLSKLVVSTTSGARAPLANPGTCGPAVSEGVIGSWAPSVSEAFPSDFFKVDWNGAGEPCPASKPFAPSFTADTTTHAAGATSPFVVGFERHDREQSVLSLSTTLPPGLLAYVPRVTQCPAALASKDEEACPAGSQIGTATVTVGYGSDPYQVTGKIYFTGPYGSAPFGLSIVLPAVAGPFNLGDVLVRAELSVNPRTAQATATSSGFPQMLDGVPLRIRSAQIAITNQNFMLNPTNCGTLTSIGTIVSAQGAQESVSSPMAVQDCRALPFAPTTTVATEAKATKTEGAGVTVKIAYPPETQSNLAKTTISFPTALPVRLPTLHQACLQATFQANPAGCPAASEVGTATVHTPILANPLTGPIYLVSYGNAKFPNVAMVLQGEGVKLEVEGESSVSSKGVLKATFPAIPDAPFSTFEANLPKKPFSEFTSARLSGQAQASQCGQELTAPVSMVAQNGREHDEQVKVQIEGCPPSVTVLKAKAGPSALTLTVRTSVRGHLRIAGSGLQTLSRSGVSAGTHTYKLAYTASGRAAVRGHRKTRLTLTLTAGKKVAAKHKSVRL
jgi:uncharacterized repeat protein (TIGR01451 family)